MKRPSLGLIRFMEYPILFALAMVVFLAVTLWLSAPAVHALPEYATRTGEPCATCHVSPGGGGPRTLRGLLWAARGKPDKVPALPSTLIAPGVRDGAELYDAACAACHGAKGEGLFAIGLAGTGISQPSIRSFIRRGISAFGMPSFDGQFTDEQLNTLVTYVAGLSNGEISPPPDEYPLPPAEFKCRSNPQPMICGKSPLRSRGN